MFSIISPLCVLSDSLFDVTKLFYEDLKQGMLEEDELIIIDNDSSIGQQEFSKIADTYIHLHKNLGYGGALNLGSKLAIGDSPFEKIHGFHHNNWYREGIKNRI